MVVSSGAGFPERGWHVFRHTFATDAARFGVNPWTLMRWLGHKSLTQTFAYLDYARDHSRPIAEHILLAGAGESDPDKKVIKMLGARSRLVLVQGNGNLTATEGA